MLDCPGFEDACERLKNYPWLSIGWHTHFWGRPVLGSDKVPSMVDKNGKFKWRKNRALANEIDYDEAVNECRAQIERCDKLLGRIPDTAGFDEETVLGRAIHTVCDEYKIAYHFYGGETPRGTMLTADDKYKKFNISEFCFRSNPETAKRTGVKIDDYKNYDPATAIMMMPISDDRIYFRALHPGFLDDYVIAESSCTVQRVKDVEAFCDERLKQWIRENDIELVNFRDVLYGTNEYQNHLRAIHSDLIYTKKEGK
jgi:predicted glycoside hydrolase/deacetylase ChbG (UPF0249 family)